MKCQVQRAVMLEGKTHNPGAELELAPEQYVRLRKAGCVITVEEANVAREADKAAKAAREKAEAEAMELASAAAKRAETELSEARAKAESDSADPSTRSRRGR